jgi:beta-glucosidase
VRAGEWLAYTVKVGTAGTYTLGFRVASSGTGGTVHVSVDGANVSGAVALPDTGAWTTWKTVTVSGVSLPAGTHVLTLVADANGSAGTVADINWIDVTAVTTPAATNAYSGTPAAVPGTIEAENYDKGGDGVGYHDTTAGNSSGAYRSDNVDIKVTTDTSGAYNVKSVRAGEWLAYTVNVSMAGTYTLDLRVASSGTGGTVHFTVDGTNVTGAIALPDTGGWSSWQTVSKTGVTLPAGTHVIKLIVDANGSGGSAADLNWFRFR